MRNSYVPYRSPELSEKKAQILVCIQPQNNFLMAVVRARRPQNDDPPWKTSDIGNAFYLIRV